MVDYLVHLIDVIARIVEFVGVMIMCLGMFYAIYLGARELIKNKKFNESTYAEIRQMVGKSILLGLEVLIAADIMETVVTAPTLDSVFVLGGIVLIRTFLSLSLQVELEGRFPWQKKNTPQ